MKHLFFILMFFVGFQGYSQFGSQQIISSEAELATDVFSADIDGDGDKDVISASRIGDFNIAWFENLDGLGNFGSYNLIDNINLNDQVYSVYASDLDGDGDMDVIATAYFLDKVFWYENLDGQGNFSAQKIIDSSADGAFDVIAADIDGDGDTDVVSASDFSGLAWYENLDGNGNFSVAKIIDNTLNNARSVVAEDIDGDGDLDVVSSSSGSVIVSWFENLDGQGSFGPQRPIGTANPPGSTLSISAMDMDGDSDIDVVTIAAIGDRVAWYENLDGQGNFGSLRLISNIIEGGDSIFTIDIDNDGDNDVLITATDTQDFLAWYENMDGLGNFGNQQIITTDVQFPRSVYAADLDNDGAMDVLSASQNDHKIAWYRNLILGVDENQASSFKIYPNPSKGIVHIDSKNEIVRRISVYDVLGKRIFSKQENTNEIDISNLQNGLYFLSITTDSGQFVHKIIKE